MNSRLPPPLNQGASQSTSTLPCSPESIRMRALGAMAMPAKEIPDLGSSAYLAMNWISPKVRCRYFEEVSLTLHKETFSRALLSLRQLVGQQIGLVGKGEGALDVLSLQSLAGLLGAALHGLEAVLVGGGELGRIDLPEALGGPVYALLGLCPKLLLIHRAQYRGQDSRRLLRRHARRRRRRRRRTRCRRERTAGLRRRRHGPRRSHGLRRRRADGRLLRRCRFHDRHRHGGGRSLHVRAGRRREPSLDRGAPAHGEARCEQKGQEPHRALRRGSRTVIVVPFPSSLRTSMVPSCICTIR